MGVPKKSRKGKKAWRKNIDAGDVEEFIQQQTHQERRGPALQDLKDDDLFVVDKAAAEGNVPKSLRKRRARGEPRQLTSQAVLAAISAGIAPVPQPVRKPKGTALRQDNKLPPLAAAAVAAAAAGSKRKHKRKPGADLADIWDAPSTSSPAEEWGRTTPGAKLLRAGAPQQQQQQPQQQRKKARSAPMSAAVAASGVLAGTGLPVVPAVEIDGAGCSYHPEPEAHQEALAEAVAKEVTKQLQVELQPKAPALHAPEGYQKPSELEELLAAGMVVGEPDEEEEQAAAAAAAAAMADDNAIDLDPADAGTAAAAAGEEDGQMRGVDRKTRQDRNREARRRAAEAEAAQRAALKQQRRQLDALPVLAAQIAEEEAAREAARLRKQVEAAEKALERPPRLGKHKYDPHAAPTAVLTSDEVTGSLRQLSPCFLVTKDRFLSLQKRGVIEPRKPAVAKKARRVEYVVGARREKAEAGQAELVAARKARQAAKKKQKGNSLAAAVADW